LRNTYLFQIYFSSSTSPFSTQVLSVFPPLLRWRVYFSNTLSPSISHFKKNLYYCRLLLYLIYFRCVKKKSVKTLPSSTVYYSTAIDVISVLLPANLIQSYTMKKSIILLVRIGEKSTNTTPLGCKPLWCSLLGDDKNGYVPHPYPVWPGTGNGSWKLLFDRKSFGSSYFGLIRFYGHVMEHCGIFTPIYLNWDGDDFAHLFLLLLRIHYYYYSVDLIW